MFKIIFMFLFSFAISNHASAGLVDLGTKGVVGHSNAEDAFVEMDSHGNLLSFGAITTKSSGNSNNNNNDDTNDPGLTCLSPKVENLSRTECVCPSSYDKSPDASKYEVGKGEACDGLYETIICKEGFEEKEGLCACLGDEYIDNGQCTECPSNSVCDGTTKDECPPGEYVLDGSCVKCSNSKGVREYSKECTISSCDDQHTLLAGECIDISCESGYFYNTETKSCELEACPKGQERDADGNCVSCKTGQYCVSCLQGETDAFHSSPIWDGSMCVSCNKYSAVKSGYDSLEPSEGAYVGSYFDFSTETCVFCPSDAPAYSASLGRCVQCYESGYFYNTETKSCELEACPEGQERDADGNCVACKTGQYCVSCLQGEPDAFHSSPIWDGSTCVSCNKYSAVKNGYDSLEPSEGAYVGSYFDFSTETCVFCPSDAPAYSASLGRCVQCYESDYNLPQSFEHDPNVCLTCEASYEWVATDSTGVYWDDASKTCKRNCPDNTVEHVYLGCITCAEKDINTPLYWGSGQCLSCAEYFMAMGALEGQISNAYWDATSQTCETNYCTAENEVLCTVVNDTQITCGNQTMNKTVLGYNYIDRYEDYTYYPTDHTGDCYQKLLATCEDVGLGKTLEYSDDCQVVYVVNGKECYTCY